MENKILYTYFKPVVEDKHYLFASEIAAMYKVKTRSNKDATTFVSAYLQYITKEIASYEQLYYCTKNGMVKVYPEKIFIPIMHNLIMKIGYENLAKITINNKNYYIKVER